MRSESLFAQFLEGVVNLNDTRLKHLETSVLSITKAVEASDWAPNIEGWARQGSWAHGTIIRPQFGKPFDADLLVYVRHIFGWEAKEYINTLHQALSANGTYRDKLKQESHCVTIAYAGERRIDIAPCVIGFGNGLHVCDRVANEFQRSEPESYSEWFAAADRVTSNRALVKVTRLLKYIRDIKRTFTCPSILLTTLIAGTVTPADRGAVDVASVPNTLLTVFRRMDDALKPHHQRPIISNPYLRDEDFGQLWDTDEQFGNFREVIAKYRGWVEEAYFEEDADKSLKAWQRVFGDEFARGSVFAEARNVSARARSHLVERGLVTNSETEDLPGLVKRFGAQALPEGFARPSYLEAPTANFGPLQTCWIRAYRHSARRSSDGVEIASLDPVKKRSVLRFCALTGAGVPWPKRDFEVRWRITNTDEEAVAAGQIRGRFENSHGDAIRWEDTAYRGVHIVEAFIFSKRRELIMAVSDPFFVVVE